MLETSSQSQKRTRSEFERQLHRLEQDSLRMGALVENSFLLAHAALFERDLESATRIESQDKQVDQIYRQIEMECISLIALQSPVARDLRLLSALMQLIRDIERIGDYCSYCERQIETQHSINCRNTNRLARARALAAVAVTVYP